MMDLVTPTHTSYQYVFHVHVQELQFSVAQDWFTLDECNLYM